MSEITRIVGRRIRNHRTAMKLSQEKLAELAGCHPTYIGQLERGEKNATVESLEKVSLALGVSLSSLFEGLGAPKGEGETISPPLREFLLSKTKEEQEQITRLLWEMEKYKTN